MSRKQGYKTEAIAADFWRMSQDAAFGATGSDIGGLSHAEAERRLAVWGANQVEASQSRSILRRIGQRLLNPLVAMLLVAAAVSGISGDLGSFVIIVAVVALSMTLDVVQEHRAELAAEALRA